MVKQDRNVVKTHEAFAEEIANVERQYCLLEVVICEGHSMQLSYTGMGHTSKRERDV